MLPKRVFNHSLAIKSLTSENRLKGNHQLDLESASSTCSGTVRKQLPPNNFIEEIALNDEDTQKCNRKNNGIEDETDDDEDDDDINNSNENSVNQKIDDNGKVHDGSGTELNLNKTESESNQIVFRGNYHRNDVYVITEGNEHTEKIEFPPPKKCVETTINNVPLRDVIQRKVSKLPNQLLLSSKELSSKLATVVANTATSTPAPPPSSSLKNSSKTKRSLFRRKTQAITKATIEAVKNNDNKNRTISNNEPIILCAIEKSQVKKPKNEHNNSVSVTDVVTELPKRLTAIQEHKQLPNGNDQHKHQQQLQQQHTASTKQKQTNIVTIATEPLNVNRKNAKTEYKYKLNEVNGNKNKTLFASKIAVDNHRDDDDAVTLDEISNESITLKHLYSKQLPLANKLKFEHFASQTKFNEKESTTNCNTSTIIVEKIPLKPPPYVNPPSPTSSKRTTVRMAQRFSFKFQKTSKNKLENVDNKNVQVEYDDEHGNYAVPYVQSPEQPIKKVFSSPKTTKSTNASAESSTQIRIANQFSIQAKTSSVVEKLTNVFISNNKNNRTHLSFESQQNENSPAKKSTRDNKDSFNDKPEKVIAKERENLNEYPFCDSSDQSRSSCSTSSDSSVCNKANDPDKIGAKLMQTKMDPKMVTNLTSPCDMLTKPEFSSSLLQNIPVRPRKGVPHLENYCLFDPSKDFLNEKELKKKYGLVNGDCMPFPIKILDKRPIDDEFIEEIIYEDQFVYDTLEDVKEEDEEIETSFPNYFTIDPDYIEQNKAETIFCNANHLQPIVESETEDIYNAQQRSDPNANVRGTDTNVYENQLGKEPIGGVPLKKSPQIEKIVRQSSQPVISTVAINKLKAKQSSQKSDSSALAKNPNAKTSVKSRSKLSPPTDLPLRSSHQTTAKASTSKKRNNNTLKHSLSTPQLRLKDLLAENAPLPQVEISNAILNPAPLPTSNRTSQYKIRSIRPASQHSDADSGFLSPVTPPSDAFVQSITSNTSKSNATANVSNVFSHCESIQGYIEVSTLFFLSHTENCSIFF